MEHALAVTSDGPRTPVAGGLPGFGAVLVNDARWGRPATADNERGFLVAQAAYGARGVARSTSGAQPSSRTRLAASATMIARG
jgi:hypothetical protein